ncbi:methyltransferase [Thalassotalea atypica]|uniref:methyltransferase n=1 Tax=Thalassotalea atypica TaxID=2054316 RepID=UPI0025723BD2|nr:methyltransferase [Thalassotalea atypica]
MLSPFIINDKNLFLDRFPLGQVNRSLQAWDATDEYLINHVQENNEQSSPLHIVVFNDSFGALSCNLTQHQVTIATDSYLSEQGIRHNIEQNNLEADQIKIISSLDPLPSDIDLILYRIPKSKSLMIEQLYRINQQYIEASADTQLNKPSFVAGAKAKEIHSSTLKEFEKLLGTTKTSLAVKKSRLVFSALDRKITNQSINKNNLCATWILEKTNFSIANLANVFAREKLDIGARLMLKHLPKLKSEQHAIDLGCGNGVLGLTLLANNEDVQVSFRDESYMAVESARLNVTQNLPTKIDAANFIVGDCLTEAAPNSADVIVCNPPFHQQHATTDHIAWQMFNESFKVLKKGGELRIVGNRQLGYHVKLKRIFGNSTVIASDDKFVILSAIKK